VLSSCGRHCLWIIGNERTLTKSRSIWEKLVVDAKNRGCFHNATDDKTLDAAITEAAEELDEQDDLHGSSRTSGKVS